MDTQKPFACKAKGCGSSFTNEDHLSVHEKKHDMLLSLEKGAGAFIADQTPTPTRLIKNCEDVGLFDDLKHVNPFDETFRRAVEGKGDSDSVETTPSSANLNQTDDSSLHTPQVFPQFDPPSATGGDYGALVEARQPLFPVEGVSAKEHKAPKKLKQTKKLACIASKPINILPTPAPPARQLLVPATISLVPATQIVALSIPASLARRPVLLPELCSPAGVQSTQSPTEISVKDRLKAHLSNSKARSPNTPPEEAKPTYGTKRSNNIKRAPKEILDDCLERRRAAALRYRRKIKKEQNDLRKRNAELAAENNQLKTLVKQLREELVCAQSYTLQGSLLIQNAGQSLFGGNKSIPATIQIPIATPMRGRHP